MACPLFMPETVVPGSPQASPLGAIFRGSCSAQGAVDDFLQHCNSGYGRAVCPRAATLEADAVRFRIRADAGGIIQVAWSTERDHHPIAVGTLSLSRTSLPTSPLEQQARVCAAIYMQSTGATW